MIELSAFLDDWSAVRRAARRPVAAWRRPLEAARRADPDPYRDRLRTILLAEDRRPEAEALKALAAAPEAAELPAPTAVLLGRTLLDLGRAEAAVALLRPAAVRHPGDVWVNYHLAGALDRLPTSTREEAVRYYTAARAHRPETAHALAHRLERMGRGAEAEAVFRDLADRRPKNPRHPGCLGRYLQMVGRTADAVPILERAVTAARAAIRLRPDDASDHFSLGRALADQGKLDEAVAELHAAIRLQPDDAEARANLGDALRRQGKLDEAIAEFRAAIRLRPDLATSHSGLGALLCDDKRDYPAAEAAFRDAIRLRPDDASDHYNLGNALLGQGRLDEAVAEYRTSVRIRPDNATVHSTLGNALRQQGKVAEAVAEYRIAVRVQPDLAMARNNLGNALRQQGKLDEAVAELRATIRLQPNGAEAHCNLGLALQSQGDYAGALAMLRRGHELGSRQPGWPYPSAQWVAEAEHLAALAARLPDLLKGKDRPKDVAERLALAQMCYDRKHHTAAARFWAGALSADPKLGEDRRAGHRYNAACAASLAAAGQGTDDPKPDDASRARLRGQALDWLTAELAAWANVLGSVDPQAAPVVQQALEHWRTDSDLAGVRDADALAKLPEAERSAWRSLWAEVDALLARSGGGRP